MPSSVDSLALEAHGSPYTPIFDEDEYGDEIGMHSPREMVQVRISTSHYRLIEWFLQRVRPKERLIIEVTARDIWFVIKTISKL